MHQALNIPEIVDIICSRTSEDDTGKGTLSHLAVTCRQFRDLALDHLWETVDYRPLRHLLSLYLIDEQKSNFYPDNEDEAWRRFDFYAVRVKSLDFVIHWGFDSQAFNLGLVARQNSHPNLFPKLKILSLTYGSGMLADQCGCFSIWSALLCPAIEAVKIEPPAIQGDPSYFFKNLSSCISEKCHNLSRIEISNILARVLDTEEMYQAVHMLIPPRHLPLSLKIELHYVSPNMIPALAYHQGIRALDILSSDSGLKVTIPRGGFPHLEKLYMVTKPSFCYELVQNLSISPITHIAIVILALDWDSEDRSLISVNQLCRVMAQCCNTDSLRVLKFTYAPDKENQTVPTINFEDFSPLLKFRNLVCLQLCSCSGTGFNDADTKRISEALPSLGFLDLLGKRWKGRYPNSQVTMVGLLEIVGNCKQLKHLELRFNATIVPGLPASFVPSKSLDTLRPGPSEITYPEAVAEFLKSVSPSVRLLFGKDDPELMHYVEWKTVGNLLQ